MKRMTAQEVRRYWYQLLDEAAAGEEILIERNGTRLVLKIAPPQEPDDPKWIRVPEANQLDPWGWEWTGSAAGLQTRRARSEP